MNLSSIIASLLLTVLSASAFAATDRTYYVTELAPQQKFDVYNDGRNTFLQSIPGLIVTGATADGEFFIVKGVPSSIRGFLNGKPITVIRGMPPIAKPAGPDPTVVNAQIKHLSEKLEALTARIPANSSQTAISGHTPVPSLSSSPGVAYGEEGAAAVSPGQIKPVAVRQVSHAERRGPAITDVYAYRVTPIDENLRMLVDRWSRMVGWKAVWDVDKDIPIGSFGETTGDWKSAIRWILSSSKFGDVPVKPCFYSNSVVRVVRETVKCNPNE